MCDVNSSKSHCWILLLYIYVVPSVGHKNKEEKRLEGSNKMGRYDEEQNICDKTKNKRNQY